jgi:hypothetical protein
MSPLRALTKPLSYFEEQAGLDSTRMRFALGLGKTGTFNQISGLMADPFQGKEYLESLKLQATKLFLYLLGCFWTKSIERYEYILSLGERARHYSLQKAT